MNEIIAQFPKNSVEEFVISLSDFNKTRFVDIRVWFRVDGTKELSPTKKGVSIPVERFPEFFEALKKANDILKNKRSEE